MNIFLMFHCHRDILLRNYSCLLLFLIRFLCRRGNYQKKIDRFRIWDHIEQFVHLLLWDLKLRKILFFVFCIKGVKDYHLNIECILLVGYIVYNFCLNRVYILKWFDLHKIHLNINNLKKDLPFSCLHMVQVLLFDSQERHLE